MALLHVDRCGAHYTAAQAGDVYDDIYSSTSFTVGAFASDGGPAIRFSDALDYFARTLSPADATNIQQFDFKISAAPSGENAIASVSDGATTQLSLCMTTSRTLRVRRGTVAGTILGTTTYVVPIGAKVHCGWKSAIGNSGSSRLEIWETSDQAAQVVLDLSSVDTQESASAQWTKCGAGGVASGSTDIWNYIVMDGSGSNCNALLGPQYVATLFASSRVPPALSDWALSSGSSVSALLDDATPDDDGTYCTETDQNGQLTVPVDVLPFSDRTVKGAQLYASTKLTSGSPSVSPIGYQSGTAHLGTAKSPTAAYTYVMQPYSAMPSGAAFSTATAFNALQWGLKLTTAGTGVRLTQVVVAVILAIDSGSHNNLLTGKTHEVTGSDNVIHGRTNEVDADGSQAHGENMTVTGDRSIGINLTSTPRTLSTPNTWALWADTVSINGSAPGAGSIALNDLTDVVISSPTTGQLLKYNGTNWVNQGLAVGDIVFVRKTADESVTSSTTLQNDDHLFFSVAANEIWAVKFVLLYTGATAGDFKVNVTVPSGATYRLGIHGLQETAAGATTFQTSTLTEGSGSYVFGCSGASALGILDGTVEIGANAGTIQLQFAQGTSSGTATTLFAKSYVSGLKAA